ncbi:hypothetical protein J7382_14675 [Shimia sp. R11_0]|nr:hypothetical protein [Shimia sp. R11_0]MBO9478790.1 hypothetical protein [Shimia sp. R11_0]
MKTQSRFIKSVVAASKADTPQMPWARGTRRAAFIAKRKGATLKRAA